MTSEKESTHEALELNSEGTTFPNDDKKLTGEDIPQTSNTKSIETPLPDAKKAAISLNIKQN